MTLFDDHGNVRWSEIVERQQLKAVFNNKSTNISTQIIKRELKRLEQNNHVTVRKPLMSETGEKKTPSICQGGEWLDSGAK